MIRSRRIYLDHAATSWPKSEAVLSAMDAFQRDEGASAGRGSYESAVRAGQRVSGCRRRIAQWIGADEPESVTFHAGGTAALNAAIHGFVRSGDHVVTTAAEHNSVLRPLAFLRDHRNVSLTIVPCDKNGRVDPSEVIDAVRPETRMVAITHVSNVTGLRQPIEDITDALAERNVAVLCDAAQSLGYLPIDVRQLKLDFLAAPAHKGAAGPLGAAMLYCHPKWHAEIQPVTQGGTGGQSESLAMPVAMPEKLEAGNLNVPAIVGWHEGLDELAESEIRQTKNRSIELSHALRERLSAIPHVNVVGASSDVPLVSLTVDGIPPSDLSAVLDAEYGIEARAGFHCAALIHRHIGTARSGTLRVSAGHPTTLAELDVLGDAIQEIAVEVNR